MRIYDNGNHADSKKIHNDEGAEIHAEKERFHLATTSNLAFYKVEQLYVRTVTYERNYFLSVSDFRDMGESRPIETAHENDNSKVQVWIDVLNSYVGQACPIQSNWKQNPALRRMHDRVRTNGAPDFVRYNKIDKSQYEKRHGTYAFASSINLNLRST